METKKTVDAYQAWISHDSSVASPWSEVGTSCQNCYTGINKTIILGPDSLNHNHNSVIKEKRLILHLSASSVYV